MSPFDLMFWVLAIVVAVCGLALITAIIAGVVGSLRSRRKPESTTILRGGDDGTSGR